MRSQSSSPTKAKPQRTNANYELDLLVGAESRQTMYGRCFQELEKRNQPLVPLGGSHEGRLTTRIPVCRQVLAG